jgi:hypothetical protein
MNRHNDIAGTLDQFLEDGPERVSDHALQRALDAIDRTPQRHRRVPWRFLDMTPVTRLASAAVVAVLAIGGLLYVVAPRLGVGPPVATTSPTPPASRAPCVAEPVNRQLLSDDCTYEIDLLGIPMSIAGTGHFIFEERGAGMNLTGIDQATNGVWVGIFRVRGIPSSPCADAMSEAPGAAPSTSTAYIDWLQASPLAGRAIADVTIGGLAGRRIDVPAGWLESAAPSATACDMLWLSYVEGDSSFLSRGDAQDARITMLDSDAGVIVAIEHFADELPSEALVEQLANIRFGP